MSNAFAAPVLFSAVLFVSKTPLTPLFLNCLNEYWDGSCSIGKILPLQYVMALIFFPYSIRVCKFSRDDTWSQLNDL
ncbi:hypothetical protein F5B21DRAFT_484962 [Xylaria acuta]|nr:hypothetical protein F5B21DRAFT_484962 [Xylaria acuta]